MPRLNEAVGIGLLAAAFALTSSLVSYYPEDASWNTTTGVEKAHNLMGFPGAFVADLLIQGFGLAAFFLPFFTVSLAWKWFFSEAIGAPVVRLTGAAAFIVASATMMGMGDWHVFGGAVSSGGLIGLLASQAMIQTFNVTGAVLISSTCLLISLYLVSTFSFTKLAPSVTKRIPLVGSFRKRWERWRESRARLKEEQAEARLSSAEEKRRARLAKAAAEEAEQKLATASRVERSTYPSGDDDEIPIRTIEDMDAQVGDPEPESEADEASLALPEEEPEPEVVEYTPPPPSSAPPWEPEPAKAAATGQARRIEFRLPPTNLLNEAEARQVHDAAELKEIATRIKSKFEEFNVLGSVVQINPGPVVTTFEFKPEAGIK